MRMLMMNLSEKKSRSRKGVYDNENHDENLGSNNNNNNNDGNDNDDNDKNKLHSNDNDDDNNSDDSDYDYLLDEVEAIEHHQQQQRSQPSQFQLSSLEATRRAELISQIHAWEVANDHGYGLYRAISPHRVLLAAGLQPPSNHTVSALNIHYRHHYHHHHHL
jgi:hypothetical protein